MISGVKILDSVCKGCVNCIKSCPTEAIRVVDGLVHIIPELCISCGECLRTCREKALGLDEDDWGVLRAYGSPILLADPTFYVQFGSYWRPSLVREALLGVWGVEDLAEEMSVAFDLVAYANCRAIEETPPDRLPLISTYCPAMIRLIRARFPELLGHLIPSESPLEIAALLHRKNKGDVRPVTLAAPCPAKIAMVREPVGRETSIVTHAVSVRRVVRDLLAAGSRVEQDVPALENKRWILWGLRGGEARHMAQFSRRRPLRTLAVSGLRNSIDLLRELELGRLQNIDFVECRVCDLGCIGGIGNAESRFLAHLRLKNLPQKWRLSPEEKRTVEELYESGIWRLEKAVEPLERLPLGEDLAESMAKLKRLKSIYAELPHLDCGACGRPSCHALAEDVVRGDAEMTDCVFKLRDRIASLAEEITNLSKNVPHTLRTRSDER